MDTIDDHDTNLGNLNAIPITNLGMLWANVNYKNPKENWINPFPTWAKQKEARKLIPKEAALLFLRLQNEHKIPSWVNKIVDREMITLASK